MRNPKSFKNALLASAVLSAIPLIAHAEAAPANGSDSGEVIVTAQHRAENVQKASVSIEVLSAKSLQSAGVTQAVDLPSIAPGVQITMGGSAAQIYIRGAGDFTTTSYNNAAVAQNFDGVSAARTQFVAGTYFDLARIEVLKGPQGTLYGRNAVGGAINMIPVEPKLGEYGGYLQVGVQNYNGTSAEGAINIPLGENAAARLSAQVVNRDGYISNGTDDDVHESFRGQIKFQPSDALSIRVLANYQHLGGRGGGMVAYNPVATAFNPVYIPSDRWEAIDYSLNKVIDAWNVIPAPDAPHVDTSKIRQDIDVWGINATVEYDLGFANLTIIPAYQKVEMDALSVPTILFHTINPVTGEPTTSEAKSLEARLGNSGDRLKWTAGVYYFNEDQNSLNHVNVLNIVDKMYVAKLNTESYAAFADVNYALTDDLRLIAGVRYTNEEKSVLANTYDVPGSVNCPGNTPCLSYTIPNSFVTGRYKGNRTNFRLGFEYDLAPDNMIFATVATGFKSGGQVAGNFDPYKPEDLTSYTIGSRNRFFNNALQANLELFYIDYKNHQENFSIPDKSGTSTQALLNAGTATSKGVSLDLVYKPTTNDSLRFAVEYTDSKYDSFVYTSFGPLPSTGCKITQATSDYTVDCSGFQMTRTPKYSGSFSYTHRIDLESGASIDITPDVTFADKRYVEPSFVANALVDAYQVYNISATYNSPENKYSFQAFVRNIGNEAVYTGGQNKPVIGGYVGLNIGAPRTYGARFRVNF